MIESVALSARSVLIAGLSAAVVGAAAGTPVDVPALSEAKIATIATQLTAATSGIESAIKNTYNAIEPWAAWGAELGQWALGFVPGLWWVAPGVSLAYFTAEPLVQAGVYTVADVLGLNFSQIGPDITAGVQQSLNNAVTYSLAWLNSLVPLPPFPPFPPRPGAAVSAAPVLPAAATTVVDGPEAKSITTPIEVAIKNTYNAVEPWAQYGMQWVNYVAGLVPIVNWFSPAIPLTYYTIEPLVRAATFAFADLIGLNFSAIGPQLWNGITTSSNNFVNGILNWINIPQPPPLPGAAAPAPAAGVRAAAAVAAPAVVAAPEAAPSVGEAATVGTAVTTGEVANSQVADSATAGTAAKLGDAPAPALTTPAANSVAAGRDTVTESAPVTAPVTEVPAPAVADIPAVDSAPANAAPAGPKGHRGQAASGGADDAGAPAKAGRHARGSQ